METFKSFVMSSVDPTKVSLFIKSLMAFAVLMGVDTVVVDEIGGLVGNLITSALMVIAAITALWGLARKYAAGQWSAK